MKERKVEEEEVCTAVEEGGNGREILKRGYRENERIHVLHRTRVAASKVFADPPWRAVCGNPLFPFPLTGHIIPPTPVHHTLTYFCATINRADVVVG